MPEGGRARLIDLFAGCGGLTQGFLDTGSFRVVAAVELDRHAASTYALNFGEHVAVEDVTAWAAGSLPFAEVVVGGPPCQGFSTLGSRNPKDPRNALWADYARVLQRVRPAFFVLENVPRWLESREFTSLLGMTTRGGPLAQWELEAHVLSAADYGVAQVRRRAIVVGRPKGMHLLGAPDAMPRRTLREVLGGVEPRVSATRLPEKKVQVLGDSVPGAFRGQDLHITYDYSNIARRRFEAVPPGGGRLDLPIELRLPAWRKADYRGATDVLGRLEWDRPAVTLRTEFFRPEKGRFLHPEENRALTHYEAALLQGFPEAFRWCGSKASIARQIGNAVPVPMAREVARHIASSLIAC